MCFKFLINESTFLTFFIKYEWVSKSCLVMSLCDPMNYTVHGILQAKIMEWVAFLFSRGSLQCKDWTHISHIADRFLTNWGTREIQEYYSGQPIPSPADLPDPGVEPGCPALQVDSLPTEQLGKLLYKVYIS